MAIVAALCRLWLEARKTATCSNGEDYYAEEAEISCRLIFSSTCSMFTPSGSSTENASLLPLPRHIFRDIDWNSRPGTCTDIIHPEERKCSTVLTVECAIMTAIVIFVRLLGTARFGCRNAEECRVSRRDRYIVAK